MSNIGCAVTRGYNKLMCLRTWYNSCSPVELIYEAWSGILYYARQYKIFNAIIPKQSFADTVFLQKNWNRSPSTLVTFCFTVFVMIITSFLAYRVYYSKRETTIVHMAPQRNMMDTGVYPEPLDQISLETQS